MSYVFSPPALVPIVLSIFLAEHVTGEFILLIPVMTFWTEASWLPKVFSMLKDISHEFSTI